MPAKTPDLTTVSEQAGKEFVANASSQSTTLSAITGVTIKDCLRCCSVAEAAIARLAPCRNRLLADPLVHHGEVIRVRARLEERKTEVKSARAQRLGARATGRARGPGNNRLSH